AVEAVANRPIRTDGAVEEIDAAGIAEHDADRFAHWPQRRRALLPGRTVQSCREMPFFQGQPSTRAQPVELPARDGHQVVHRRAARTDWPFRVLSPTGETTSLDPSGHGQVAVEVPSGLRFEAL